MYWFCRGCFIANIACLECGFIHSRNDALLEAITTHDIKQLDHIMTLYAELPKVVHHATELSLLKDDTLEMYIHLRDRYHMGLDYSNMTESLYTKPFPSIRVHEFARRGAYHIMHFMNEPWVNLTIPFYIGITLAHYANGYDRRFARITHLLDQFPDTRKLRHTIATAFTQDRGDINMPSVRLIANDKLKQLALLAIDDLVHETRMCMLMATGIRAQRAKLLPMPPPDTWTDMMEHHK